jgi:hypothetical protein
VRPRGAVLQRGLTFSGEAVTPLAHGARADAKLACHLSGGLACLDTLDDQHSTMRRGSERVNDFETADISI